MRTNLEGEGIGFGVLIGAAPVLGCPLTPDRSLEILVFEEEEPVWRLGRRSKLYKDNYLGLDLHIILISSQATILVLIPQRLVFPEIDQE